MAYGVISNKTIAEQTSCLAKRKSNGYQFLSTVAPNSLPVEYITRGGGKLPPHTLALLKKLKKPIGYRTVVYYIREPNREKKPVRLQSTDGRYYWTRPKWIKVRREKRKPIYSKSKKSCSVTGAPNLPSNALNFTKISVKYYPLDSVSNAEWSVTGRLTNQFQLHPTSSYYGYSPYNTAGPARSNVALASIASIDQSCYTSFLNRIQDSKINLLQAFAERHQTALLIVDLAIKATKALKALKSGNLTQASRALFPKGKGVMDNASDYWLSYQYGIRPLLQDISGAMAVLSEDRGISFDVIRRMKKEIPFQQYHEMQGSNGLITSNLYCRWDTFIEGEVSVKYKASVVVTNPGLQQLQSLGVLDIKTLVWELIPYSFVVDWVFPVGNYLNSINALTGVTISGAHKTVFSKELISHEKDFNGTAGGYSSSGWCGQDIERIMVTRSIITNLPPAPKPIFSLENVSLKNLASSLALLNQLK